MWLMRKLGPDFKTITDFRKDNRQVFKGVFRQFVLLCKGLGLVGGELVALDGRKFKAVNSGERHFTGKSLSEDSKSLTTRSSAI
jgi:transposase